jgi:hypothetical protein
MITSGQPGASKKQKGFNKKTSEFSFVIDDNFFTTSKIYGGRLI